MAKKNVANPFEKKPSVLEDTRVYTDKLNAYKKDLMDKRKRLVLCEGLPHTGKAMVGNTPVLTKDGFKPISALSVGDKVFDENGEECNVTGFFPQGSKKVYRVTFEDKTFIDCCEEHLWKYNTYKDRQVGNGWKVKNLKQILEKHKIKLSSDRNNLAIPVCKPIQFEKKELPLDPYVLGILLGDGSLSESSITVSSAEEDIIERMNSRLNYGSFSKCPSDNYSWRYKSYIDRKNQLLNVIRDLGLWGTKSSTKFIPNDYLFSNEIDRRDLLAGLFDSDGSVSKQGCLSFSSTNEILCDQFIWLCRSLGYRTTKAVADRGDKGIEYCVVIYTIDNIYYSEKHIERGLERKGAYDRSILRITKIENLMIEENMFCISVDSLERTFITKDFIVTHNTLNAIESGIEQVLSKKYTGMEKLVIIRPIVIPECGLLPGGLEDKMALYLRQAKEYVNDASMEGWEKLCYYKQIEILPADQLQGNHFRSSFVVIDEGQNIHYSNTFKTLSRIGDGAKFTLIGDTSLGQENTKIKHNNILSYCVNKFAPYNHPAIAVHSFYDEDNDILGDDFTKFIIKALIPDFVRPEMRDGEGR